MLLIRGTAEYCLELQAAQFTCVHVNQVSCVE